MVEGSGRTLNEFVPAAGQVHIGSCPKVKAAVLRSGSSGPSNPWLSQWPRSAEAGSCQPPGAAFRELLSLAAGLWRAAG